MSRRNRHGRRPTSSTAVQPLPDGPDEMPAEPANVAVAERPSAPPEGVMAPALAAEAEPARPAVGPAVDQGAAEDAVAASQDGSRSTCTQAQLRRFIKSRPWIPMHELRRRFGITGVDDDVTPVRVHGTTIFVGLPAAEGRMLGELLASSDVGYELSLDPEAPIVVGVYPMRPVPRG